MILLDFTQIFIANFSMQQKRNQVPDDELLACLRFMAIQTVLNYQRKFSKKYGKMVICCDSKSWRNDSFDYYKWSRRNKREDSTVDWPHIFGILHQIIEEFQENFPFRVLHTNGAEADDIIATLALNIPEKTVIVSGDKDFQQLHCLGHIEQFSPIKKNFIKCKEDMYLLEHIIKGDATDGIPNMLSDDDIFTIEGKRQTPVTKVRMKELINIIKSKKLAGSLQKNFERNRELIDFDYIPEALGKEILKDFGDQREKSRIKNKLMVYLGSLGLLDRMNEF